MAKIQSRGKKLENHSERNMTLLQQYGLDGWGASGPYKKVYEKFGITGASK